MAKIFKTTSVLGGGCVVLEQKNIYLKVLTCFSLSLSLSLSLSGTARPLATQSIFHVLTPPLCTSAAISQMSASLSLFFHLKKFEHHYCSTNIVTNSHSSSITNQKSPRLIGFFFSLLGIEFL